MTKSMSNILIRVDGNSEIGMGHINRCLSVAFALKEIGDDVIFILSDSSARQIIDEAGFKCFTLDIDYRDIVNDTNKIEGIVVENRIELILVDSYYATDDYLEGLKRFAKVACFDGLYKFTQTDLLLINYNAAATQEYYQEKFLGKKMELLIGLPYVPLKPSFWDVKPGNGFREKKRVLITTGATDKLEICDTILNEVIHRGHRDNIDIVVAVGKYFHKKEELLNRYERYQNIQFLIGCDDLQPIMKETDIAITAAGTTAYELLRLEIPTILFAMTDIQLTGSALAKHVCWMGDIRDVEGRLNILQVKHMVSAMFEYVDDKENYCKLLDSARNIIDGQGARRIAKAINRHIE